MRKGLISARRFRGIFFQERSKVPATALSNRLLQVLVMGLALTSGISFLAGQSIEESETRIDIMGKTMGPIVYRVVIIKDERTPDPNNLAKTIQATLDHVNDLMSTYLAVSDVTRFNKSSSTDWISVDEETAKVMKRSLEISELTHGAFDVTVAPAVDLWHFGPNPGRFDIPEDAKVKAVKGRVGFDKVEVRLKPPAIRKNKSGIELDFSAIAKGYAVDRVAERLSELNCDNFLVEVGGEVAGCGATETGNPWRIGVESPNEFARIVGHVALLENRAMATSGDYRNFEIIEGRRFSHTIDPATCRPTENFLATACVVADDCMTADAFATALMVLGTNKGAEICETLGMPFLMIERSAADPSDPVKFKTYISSDFPLAKTTPESPNSKGILPVFLAALVVFGLAVLGMAAGSIFANKPIKGSCGGLASMPTDDGDLSCSICEQPTTDCDRIDS